MSRPPPSPTPSDALRTAAPDLARQVGLVLGGLCTAIAQAQGSAGTSLLRALIVLAWGRVNRTRHRLQRLLARVAAGWLPSPTAPRAPVVADPAAPRRRRVGAPALGRLPRARAWLVRMVGYHAAGRGSQLEHLLTDPAMAEFLAAVPSAARMLRPLCRTLGIAPPVLGFPRPPDPRPAKPARQKRAAPSAIAQVYAALAALPAPEPASTDYHFITNALVR
jgi:hypothetical protein